MKSVRVILMGMKKFFDILEEKTQEKTTVETFLSFGEGTIYKKHPCTAKGYREKKVRKGTRGMPRLSEAKKDVISCDKHRGSANETRSGDFRMGKPDMLKTCRIKRERAELKHLSRRRKRK